MSEPHPPGCTCRPCCIDARIRVQTKHEIERLERECQKILAAGGDPLILILPFPEAPRVVDRKDLP